MPTFTSADVIKDCIEQHYNGVIEIPYYLISIPVNGCVKFFIPTERNNDRAVYINFGTFPVCSNFPCGLRIPEGFEQHEELCKILNQMLDVYKMVTM